MSINKEHPKESSYFIVYIGKLGTFSHTMLSPTLLRLVYFFSILKNGL